MKISNAIFGLIGATFVGTAGAADITIYHAPTCPHCRNAREFISSTLIYEYDNLKVSEINIMNTDNRQAFVDALFKCGYKSGGVPVMVVGEKCFQGYAVSTQPELRVAIEADLTAEQKAAAEANRKAMEQDKDAFIAAHADRKSAISELEPQKKTDK